MSKVQKFEELDIFQQARDLCKEVYAITKGGEFHKDSRFVQQIHAAAGSVMDNIAEGASSVTGTRSLLTSYISRKGLVGKYGVNSSEPLM